MTCLSLREKNIDIKAFFPRPDLYYYNHAFNWERFPVKALALVLVLMYISCAISVWNSVKSHITFFNLISHFQNKFQDEPAVLITAEHLRTGKEYDAALIWTEDVTKD